MLTFEQDIYEFDNVPPKIWELRYKLIEEEYKEYCVAKTRGTEELDAICDLIYVIVGTAVAASIKLEQYISHQLRIENSSKPNIGPEIHALLDEIGCLFPCPRRTPAALNNALRVVIDAAKVRGYDLWYAFEAVHVNNMKKLWPRPSDAIMHESTPKGEYWLVKDLKGKIIKSPLHHKVDLAPFVLE